MFNVLKMLIFPEVTDKFNAILIKIPTECIVVYVLTLVPGRKIIKLGNQNKVSMLQVKKLVFCDFL